MEERQEALSKMFQRMNMDHVQIWTDESYIDPLMKFFKMRERRLRS